MPLPFNWLTTDNPLIKGLFIVPFSFGQGDFPPPGSDFRITDAEEKRITDDINDNRITDS